MLQRTSMLLAVSWWTVSSWPTSLHCFSSFSFSSFNLSSSLCADSRPQHFSANRSCQHTYHHSTRLFILYNYKIIVHPYKVRTGMTFRSCNIYTKQFMELAIVYMGWKWRHFVYNSIRRHIGGILCCSGVTTYNKLSYSCKLLHVYTYMHSRNTWSQNSGIRYNILC